MNTAPRNRTAHLSHGAVFVLLGGLFAVFVVSASSVPPANARVAKQQIPRVWDEAALKDFMLQPPGAEFTVEHITPEYYYSLPERVIHKTYPVYHPDFEPPGYLDSLRALPSATMLDMDTIDTEPEWIRAGDILFDSPQRLFPIPGPFPVAGLAAGGVPVAADGTFPFHRYVVLPNGDVRLGVAACGNCHTRVMPDGAVLRAVQGNYPLERLRAGIIQTLHASGGLVRNGRTVTAEEFVATQSRELYKAPWVDHPSQYVLDTLSVQQAIALNAAIPPGVMLRQGSHFLYPTKVPDLHGLQHQRFLDATGLIQQRSIADLMRYAAATQFVDMLNRYNGFVPVIGTHTGLLPPSASLSSNVFGEFNRFSDAHLFALAKFLYSLEPLPSPHAFDAETVALGERVFIEQGCVTCHPPPTYTNNELTPALGFDAPDDHFERLPIFDVSVETDPGLALYTRRGTGYYKVPSLRGLWYRERLFHDGSLSLEQVLDPARLEDDFVPAGFRGADSPTRAVRGHEFGLELEPPERAALIAYLKSL